jgi:hypothetical protein
MRLNGALMSLNRALICRSEEEIAAEEERLHTVLIGLNTALIEP